MAPPPICGHRFFMYHWSPKQHQGTHISQSEIQSQYSFPWIQLIWFSFPFPECNGMLHSRNYSFLDINTQQIHSSFWPTVVLATHDSLDRSLVVKLCARCSYASGVCTQTLCLHQNLAQRFQFLAVSLVESCFSGTLAAQLSTEPHFASTPNAGNGSYSFCWCIFASFPQGRLFSQLQGVYSSIPPSLYCGLRLQFRLEKSCSGEI